MRVHEACVSRKGKHEVQASASDVLIFISGNGTPFSHGRKIRQRGEVKILETLRKSFESVSLYSRNKGTVRWWAQ